MQDAQDLVRRTLLIERESDLLAGAASAEAVRARYGGIAAHLESFDQLADRLAAAGDEGAILDLRQASQLFRNNANVVAQLREAELQAAAAPTPAAAAQLQSERHSQGFRDAAQALRHDSLRHRRWVAALLAASLLLAWLASHHFLGRHVLSRLQLAMAGGGEIARWPAPSSSSRPTAASSAWPTPPSSASAAADLKKLRLCAVNGYNYAAFGLDAEQMEAGSQNLGQSFLKLKMKRCDALPERLEIALGYQSLGIADFARLDIGYELLPDLPPSTFHMMVSRRAPHAEELLRVLNEQIELLNSGDGAREIAAKYAVQLPPLPGQTAKPAKK